MNRYTELLNLLVKPTSWLHRLCVLITTFPFYWWDPFPNIQCHNIIYTVGNGRMICVCSKSFLFILKFATFIDQVERTMLCCGGMVKFQTKFCLLFMGSVFLMFFWAHFWTFTIIQIVVLGSKIPHRKVHHLHSSWTMWFQRTSRWFFSSPVDVWNHWGGMFFPYISTYFYFVRVFVNGHTKGRH